MGAANGAQAPGGAAVKESDYVDQVMTGRTKAMRRFLLERVPAHKRARVKAMVEAKWRRTENTRSR